MKIIVNLLAKKLEDQDKKISFPNEDLGQQFALLEEWW